MSADHSEQFRALVECFEDAVVGQDVSGNITLWNGGAERLFGWKSSDVVGKSSDLLAPPDRHEEVALLLDRVRGGQRVARFETVRLTKSGQCVDVALSVAPTRDPKGNVTGAVTIAHDIAPRRQFEQELFAAKESAEEANRAKSRFLANVSHELRTPLNAIIGYSEMLVEEATENGHGRYLGDLNKIRDAGRHLLKLISDVLDFSKIEAGRMPLFLETFDVREMLGEISSTLSPLAARNRNSLEVESPDNLGTMHADLTKVRQCLFNLVGNACKFTEDGTIRVSASREVLSGKPWLLFCVSDTGIGMSAEQIERLFVAFAQAESSISRQFGGTGLGLTISRQLARMMGGDVTASSELGAGSTFTLALPAHVEAQSETTDAAAAHKPPGLPETTSIHQSGGQVLIIDDDASSRDLIARIVRGEGFEPVLAESGEEGLNVARATRPSLIMLDVMMPGMDGWSVLSALKLDPATAGVPVIVATVLEDRDIAWALGAAHYLMKPITRERLCEIVKKYKPTSSSGGAS